MFDKLVLSTAIKKLGLPSALSDVALQSLCLPIRFGGFGLQRISVVSPAAFWSAVAQAVPDITALIPASKYKAYPYQCLHDSSGS